MGAGQPRQSPDHPHPPMRLRQKLGEDGENPTYIFAEPRVGCRMAEGGDARAAGAGGWMTEAAPVKGKGSLEGDSRANRRSTIACTGMVRIGETASLVEWNRNAP